MSSLRHLWFDTRHLLGGASGQALQAELDALEARPRETILATGDRLAEVSLTLAQAFCRSAPAAWRVFGAKVFQHWVRIGEKLAREEPASRDGAAAYFAVAPHEFSQVGLGVADEWAAIGRETLRVSRRLGVQFLQSSAPLLSSLPPPLSPRLQAWATHGCALLRCKGWKGEFLAVSYFASAPAALPVLTTEEMGEWARLGVLIQDAGPWTFYARLPDAFAELSVSERRSLLRDCQAAATSSPKAAEELFFQLPPVLNTVAPPMRAFLLTILSGVIRSDPAAVLSLVPLLRPLLKAVGIESWPELQGTLVSLAWEFPAGIPPLIRTLPRAFEEAGERGMTDWITTGRAIARDNPAAGVTFFSLESRTSVKVLRSLSPGADLEEVQELLRKYIHMLSGSSVNIRRQEFLSYPPPLEEFPVAEAGIPLPGRIDLFPTFEENFRLFRVLAVHHAGRREWGTYEFSIETLWPRLPTSVRHLIRETSETGKDASAGGGLPGYFHCFPHPEIVEGLFLLAETRRIHERMSKTYRGLRPDLDWAASLSLPCLWPDIIASLAPGLLPPVSPSSTVYDSALWAAEMYLRLLSSLALARQTHDPSSFDPVMFEKVTGDALIDPDMDDSPPPADAPDLPQLELDPETDEQEGGTPLSPEELKALLEAGVDLHIRQGKPDRLAPQGLYVSDLIGKVPGNGERDSLAPEDTLALNGKQRREREEGLTFYYDEWDYQIADYRSQWCRLREIVLAGDAGAFFTKTLSDYTALTPAVRHEFQRIRPELYRVVRGLEDGEEFDLNAVVTATSDLRARVSPSPKLYTTRRQTERDVAALFLLDMSASTDEPLVSVERQYVDEDPDDWQAAWKKRSLVPQPTPRRIIDVTKEALVLMAEALEEIGDTYAIYGFSGQGRDNVEFYHVKSFTEALSPTVKGRIGAIEPKRSTRMGAALRHSLEKLKDIACRVKLLVLLSDGFPQDMDYGADRRSITHGIRDTMMALREAEQAGVLTFCLTVDKAGHDYLREMCEPSRYLVLEDVASLPTELPKVYQRYIRPRGI